MDKEHLSQYEKLDANLRDAKTSVNCTGITKNLMDLNPS